MKTYNLKAKHFGPDTELGKLLFQVLNSDFGSERLFEETKGYEGYFIDALSQEEVFELLGYSILTLVSANEDEFVAFSLDEKKTMEELQGIRLAMLVVEGTKSEQM